MDSDAEPAAQTDSSERASEHGDSGHGGEGKADAAQGDSGHGAQHGTTHDAHVQSTSPIGANTYGVQPSVPNWDGPEDATLRLTALGRDFTGLNWDIWVTQEGSRVMAVNLRSVAGGSNVDLLPAIEAAQAELRNS